MSETAADRVEEAASRFSKFVVIVFAITGLYVAATLDRHPWAERAVEVAAAIVGLVVYAWIITSV